MCGLKCRLGDLDASPSEADISDGHREHARILLSQVGIDLDEHTTMCTKVLPRGHER